MKRYRAVPLHVYYTLPIDTQMFWAADDVDAATQADEWFGPSVSYILWQNDRHVLTCEPIAPFDMRSYRGGCVALRGVELHAAEALRVPSDEVRLG